MFKTGELHQAIVLASDNNYLGALKEMPTVCIFGTQWCNDTMRMLLLALPEFVESCGERIKFCYVSIQDDRRGEHLNPALEEKLGIEEYPTVIAFAGGEEIERVVSTKTTREQKEDIARLIALLKVL